MTDRIKQKDNDGINVEMRKLTQDNHDNHLENDRNPGNHTECGNTSEDRTNDDLDSIGEEVTNSKKRDSSNNDKRRQSLGQRLYSLGGHVKKKLSVVPPDSTPVDWKMISLIFISLFASAFSLTFLFPFLPEMVLYFGYKEEDKGYYSGLVASGVFAGRAFGSYFWGWLSDKYGRRPIVLMTIFGNGLFSIIFGFTVNLPMAIATRFLTGLANGTVGTAKTILYEISDDTNQAVGMSILSMSWGAGVILGPTIGGLLASPASKYPEVFDPNGLFGQFPYLLPSLVVGGTCLVIIVIDFFCLPETINRKQKEDMISVQNEEKVGQFSFQKGNDLHEEMSLIKSPCNTSGMISMSVEDLHLESDALTYQIMRSQENLFRRRTFSESHRNVEKTEDVSDLRGSLPNMFDMKNSRKKRHSGAASDVKIYIENVESDKKPDNPALLEITQNGHSKRLDGSEERKLKFGGETDLECSSEESKNGCSFIRKIKSTSLVILCRIPQMREAVFLYSVFSFAIIGFEEIFPVWASTKVWLSGLGFNPSEIGAALGITAAPMLLFSLYIFPFLVNKFGLKKTFIACTLLNGFLLTAVPTIHLIQSDKSVLWACLMILIIPSKILNSCCFSATSLFVNNSSPKNMAGAVNGIAMTMTAVARTLAPTVGGSIYAWSIGYGSANIGPPFDVNLAFFVFGLILWLSGVYSIFLSDSLCRQKK